MSEHQIFRPNRNGATLYHVYDNLSQTPYIPGEGIMCCGRNTRLSPKPKKLLITPNKILAHLNWANESRTPFISFYGNLDAALEEAERRQKELNVWRPYSREWYRRDPNSVRIAEVKVVPGSEVWAMSRQILLRMMALFSSEAKEKVDGELYIHEWIVWGHVPEEYVVQDLEPEDY